VSNKFSEDTKKILDAFDKNSIRVDLDDRPITMQKKIREAETEWINFVVVVGQREITSQTLSVRDRESSKIRNMKLQELVDEIKEKVKDKPFKHLTLPMLLSKRPQFSF
jgi:threonyl-tRNA synthetase